MKWVLGFGVFVTMEVIFVLIWMKVLNHRDRLWDYAMDDLEKKYGRRPN